MKKLEKIVEVVRIKQEVQQTEDNLYTIRSPYDAKDLAIKHIGDDDREVFLVMCLNTKNQINAIHRCSVGTVNSAIVSPREVFKVAILNNSASIIVAHNHPTGIVLPSREDIECTKRLNECGNILDIQLLDSLIVSANGGYTSLKEKGYL